jgi:predicted permease
MAELLIRMRLPREIADAVAGDLEEEYRARAATGGGALQARIWFWRQALTLRAGNLRRMARRLRATRPTWERNRPRHAGGGSPDPWHPIHMLFRDLIYAMRRMARTPGFTLVAILSLALGIGANSAMFSLVNSVLIRDLPVESPDQLVELYTADSGGYPFATSSHPDYLDLRQNTDVFEGVIGTRTFISRMDRGAEPEIVFGELISWDYFQVLGVPMHLGRSFVPEEDASQGTHPVVILGYRTWAQEFGARADILGGTVRLDGKPFTVVGVAPEAFTGSMPVLVTSMYVPLMMTNELMGGLTGTDQIGRRGSRSMFLKGRLREGITAEQAEEAVGALSVALAETYPDTNENRAMTLLPTGKVSLHPLVDRALLPVAGLLLTVVGLVLLIACANLASFLLARAEDRRKEIAVRLALGANRRQLIRQLLVETTLLAVLGGLGGILLANWTLGVLMSFQPPLPIPVNFDVSLDRNVLWFTAGVSILAGFAFGLAPALQATKPDVSATLKNEGTGGGRPRRFSLRSTLVVTQVAFSFLLLIGAGLFVRSMQKAQLIDPGFYTGPAALIWPMPEMSGYESAEDIRLFNEAFAERLSAHPAIDQVAMTDMVPLGAGVQTGSYVLPGVPSEQPLGDHDIDMANVAPGYFDVMDISILRGRAFQESDLGGDPRVVVNEAFANRFYPGEDLVGRTIEDRSGSSYRIIGVSETIKIRTLGEAPRPAVYELYDKGSFGVQVIARGSGTSTEILAAARQVLEEVDTWWSWTPRP